MVFHSFSSFSLCYLDRCIFSSLRNHLLQTEIHEGLWATLERQPPHSVAVAKLYSIEPHIKPPQN